MKTCDRYRKVAFLPWYYNPSIGITLDPSLLHGPFNFGRHSLDFQHCILLLSPKNMTSFTNRHSDRLFLGPKGQNRLRSKVKGQSASQGLKVGLHSNLFEIYWWINNQSKAFNDNQNMPNSGPSLVFLPKKSICSPGAKKNRTCERMCSKTCMFAHMCTCMCSQTCMCACMCSRTHMDACMCACVCYHFLKKSSSFQ